VAPNQAEDRLEDALPVPVYNRRQRDVLWNLFIELFPRLAKVGRDEIMRRDVLVQGLRFLAQSLLTATAPERLERLNRAMVGASRGDSPSLDRDLPVYYRRQRHLIYGRALRLFPALETLEPGEVVASDYTCQALRLTIELVYAAEAKHDHEVLGIPWHLANERATSFVRRMIARWLESENREIDEDDVDTEEVAVNAAA
jgi:hypothetical protein